MTENIQIVKLAPGDAKHHSDYLVELSRLLNSHDAAYPGIQKWFKQKVIPGIRNSGRTAFLGLLDGVPIASAITKNSLSSKFCHLNIREDLQDSNVGEMFFSLMAVEMRPHAKECYFTLPSSLWEEKGTFFQSFGFETTRLSEVQYRLDPELYSHAPFSTVWQRVLEKIPKLSQFYSISGYSPEKGLLMSIKPEFAEKIVQKKKTVEIRRKFSTKWVGETVAIYATAPVMALVGEARIDKVESGNPINIWSEFSGDLGCTKQDFEQYCAGADEVFAISFNEARSYPDCIPLSHAESLLNETLTPPQSYITLENNKPWAKAVGLAAYLHACHGTSAALRVDVGRTSVRAPLPPEKTVSRLKPLSLQDQFVF